jgi:HEPN domain-containing protein
MNGDDSFVKVVREWIGKAEEDLLFAEIGLKVGKRCPTSAICFHAQQCIEKYLKALLVWRRIDFRKTHSIGELLVMIGKPIGISISIKKQNKLTDYATVTRYPGNYEPITRLEAKRAVSMARRVRAAVRKRLPEEAFEKPAR